MRVFNTRGACYPSMHYMVDISERVQEIRKMVDAGDYFTINCPRQYGKTTTMNALAIGLRKDNIVLKLNFQSIGNGVFQNEITFSQGLSRLVLDRHRLGDISLPESILSELKEINASGRLMMDDFFRTMMGWINQSDRPVILMIDEVDSATNNQVFLDFLAQLRSQYLDRDEYRAIGRAYSAFQSVILAGVTDVKHLKSKIRDDSEHRVNSPWNIAADFTIDMSLSETGIKGMLEEYEADHHTGMDTAAIAHTIREWTDGYPFLVSRICMLIDTVLVPNRFPSLRDAWTQDGLDEAIKTLISEDNMLFQSLTGKLINFPEMRASLHEILMEGKEIVYNPNQISISQMAMYGLIRNEDNKVRVANRIFETVLYDLFVSDERMKSSVFYDAGRSSKNIFVTNGRLNVRRILERFCETYTEIYGPLEERFKEKDGREQFLMYLKPIINGTGNYYIEAQTRDERRMDVIIDYLGQRYIIELKIWRGERYNEKGEQQICDYLDYYGLTTGYMLSFNFNKKKTPGVKRVEIRDKVLYEATV